MVFDFFFFFKQKTAYEMRISDWSSDVCSSDLGAQLQERFVRKHPERPRYPKAATVAAGTTAIRHQRILLDPHRVLELEHLHRRVRQVLGRVGDRLDTILVAATAPGPADHVHDDEGLVVGPSARKTDDGVAALTRRRNPVRPDRKSTRL